MVELRWTDEQGEHFEQGDLDVWIHLPDRLAFNIEKFGQRLMWLGSSGRRSWLFDFRSDETVLHLAGSPQEARRLPIEPAAVLRLCGLTPLPEAPPEPPAVEYDADRDAIVVTVELAGPTRLFLDRRRGLPVRVEELSADGSVALYSRIKLARYEPLAVGAAPLGGPEFPTLVDIVGADGTAAKLAVRSPTDEVADRYFDLDWLLEVFPPDRVEGELPGQP